MAAAGRWGAKLLARMDERYDYQARQTNSCQQRGEGAANSPSDCGRCAEMGAG